MNRGLTKSIRSSAEDFCLWAPVSLSTFSCSSILIIRPLTSHLWVQSGTPSVSRLLGAPSLVVARVPFPTVHSRVCTSSRLRITSRSLVPATSRRSTFPAVTSGSPCECGTRKILTISRRGGELDPHGADGKLLAYQIHQSLPMDYFLL